LFEVNEKDSWQVIPFFVGFAGTGKSVILDTVTSFFNEEDIETVSNTQQKGFGLETVFDKLGWKVLEVKSDFSIDQAQLQSMITGEEVSIMRKGKPALTVVWKSPGILAGNELANWSDNSGSISRRMVLINFNRKVDSEVSNPHMKEYIRNEKPALLHKIVSLYLDCIDACGNKNIWGH
jgi:phage/plasmid-associated DNA primase